MKIEILLSDCDGEEISTIMIDGKVVGHFSDLIDNTDNDEDVVDIDILENTTETTRIGSLLRMAYNAGKNDVRKKTKKFDINTIFVESDDFGNEYTNPEDLN